MGLESSKKCQPCHTSPRYKSHYEKLSWKIENGCDLSLAAFLAHSRAHPSGHRGSFLALLRPQSSGLLPTKHAIHLQQSCSPGSGCFGSLWIGSQITSEFHVASGDPSLSFTCSGGSDSELSGRLEEIKPFLSWPKTAPGIRVAYFPNSCIPIVALLQECKMDPHAP